MGLLDQFPNLDDETFEEIVKNARLLIPQFTREWTDHNVHDPGITFLELFAWLAEMQIYQLNRVSDKNYKKFLKILGDISPYDERPAKVDITFDSINDKPIEKGTEIVTEIDGKKIVFETEEDINLIHANLKSIITKSNSQVIDNTKANKKDDIYFAAFGEKGDIGATLELGFDRQLPKKEIQITFDLFDEDLPSPGIDYPEPKFSVNLVWEYFSDRKWKELALKKDTTLALNRSGSVVLDISSAMDPKDEGFWIRCRWKEGQYEIPPLINKILLNTISAAQIESINYSENGLGIPDQKIELKKKPVISGSQKIVIGCREWKEKDDFEASGPGDEHYVFDPEKGEITFGNGLNGSIPEDNKEISISYKTTLGQKGNVPAGQKWKINKLGFENVTGENYKQATGGLDAESIEHAKLRAKKDFEARYRAITSEDYEQLALSTPGVRVARAKVIPDYNPEYPCIKIPGSITVVIVPYTRMGEVTPVPGKGFLQTVSSFLDIRRLVTADLHVIEPRYVKISVTCKVRLMKKSSPSAVVKRVQNELKKFLNPLKGGPDGKGWPFGRAVYPSEIYQIIDNIEGIDYASDLYLSTESADGKNKKENVKDKIKISPVAIVFSGEHKIEIME